MIGLHHAAETFVGTMVLDGVLERHRDLRVGVIELGAGWVPAMLRRLDQIAEIWKRSEPELAALAAHAVGPDHRADGLHAVPVRGRRARCSGSRTPTCTCSPATTPTSRAAATRSAASARRSPASTTTSSTGSTRPTWPGCISVLRGSRALARRMALR